MGRVRQSAVSAAVLTVAAFPLATAVSAQGLDLDESIEIGSPDATSRRALGGTVTTIIVEDLPGASSFRSIQDILTGRVPGLRYTRLSGDVGTGSPMTLRGVGSFDLARNQPLVYMDGIRIDADVLAGPAVSSGPAVSVLDDLDPQEIERIEILKGPAAAGLYGTEASAGVIHVITKSGLEGAPKVNVSVRRGFNYVSDPIGRLGRQWACPSDPSPGPVDCQAEEDLLSYSMYEEATRYIANGYFPWPTDNLLQSGGAGGYDVSVRGGTSSVRYFLAASYDDEEGAVWYNSDERLRMRANVGVSLGEMLTLNARTAFTDGRTRFLTPVEGDGGVWTDIAWSNGFFLDRVTPFSDPGGFPRSGGFQEHLPSDVAEVEATRDYTRFTGSLQLRFESPEVRVGGVTGRITSRALVGLDKGWDVNQSIFPLEAGIVPAHLEDFTSFWNPVYIPETVDGQMAYARPVSTQVTLDYSLTVSAEWGEAWGFDTSFGAQLYQEQRELFANSGQGFASTLSRTINQIAQADITTTFEFIEDESVGYYVQEDMSWRDRVFLTAGLRLEDSSSFGVLTPIQTYPRVSGAWVVSEDGLWGVDAVDVLRLRGGWGKGGRRPTARSSEPNFVETPGPGGLPTVRPVMGRNPRIRPEVSREVDVGFDVGLLGNRFGASFSHYWRKDERLILGLPVPDGDGVPDTVEQNLGRIDNWGWEALLTGRAYDGEAFSVDVGFSFDYVNNEIKELGAFEATPGIALGLPFPNQFTDDLVVSAQFDPTGDRSNAFGQAISAVCDEGVSLAPDPSVPDATQYGRRVGGTLRPCQDIANRNLFIGPAFATHAVSVSPRVNLLGDRLQVFALAEGQYGRTSQANTTEWSHIYNNSRASRLENDPQWVYGDRIGDDTKRELYDADFWKLREIGVRYALPTPWAGRIGADRASVSLSGHNVWTIWRAQSEIYGHEVADPELGTPTLSGNGNFWEAPPISSVSVTLRATF